MYAQTRPRFILSSEGVFGGMEFEPMLTPREKSPLPKMSPEEDRTRDTVDSEPKHYQLSYSGPPIAFCEELFLHLVMAETCFLSGYIFLLKSYGENSSFSTRNGLHFKIFGIHDKHIHM